MKKYNEVPLKKGYLNYDKNAEHVKTFSGLYRPLIVFANEPEIGKQLTDFIAEGKKHLIDWPKDINLKNKSTKEIRNILSHKIITDIVINNEDKNTIKDIIDVSNYYTYSCIMLYSRNEHNSVNDYLWQKLKEHGVRRAAFCKEDFYKGAVDWTIMYKAFRYLYFKLTEEQFTFAQKYGIIKCKESVNNTKKHSSYSNIHIN
tara:strand:+ start:713 stop:1318 length:606 start_codon:yes stop_codon:yes gene_type:complete